MKNTEQKRYTGYLSKLVSSEIPKNFLLFDTETTVPNKEGNINSFNLKLGCAIYIQLDKDLSVKREIRYTFHSILEFIDILENHTRSKNTLYVMAHNIGFDIRVLDLCKTFNDLGYISSPPIINERMFNWKINTGKGKLHFMDTSNLGIQSVYLLGKDMGYPKRDIDFNKCTIDELAEYCMIDVEILMKFIVSYISYLDYADLGSFKTTLASQTLTTFRYKFMDNPPFIHNETDIIKSERKAYHGGRVECFYIGKLEGQEYYYLDVNSMYPYCMKSDNLPVKLLGANTSNNILFLKPRMSKYYVISEVTVNTDEPVYPLMQNNKLIFPTGTFRVVLNHDELQYALDHNHIIELHNSIQYERGSLFTKYVDYFYDLKVKHTHDNNKTYRMIDKLFLNSLYGKFGQTKPHRLLMDTIDFNGVYRMPLMDIENGIHFSEICWYGDIYKEYKEGETSHSFPAIASAITAKARMLLWKYIKKASKENVYYCDTDSLIVNKKGYDNLYEYLNEDILGYLKLEKQANIVHIRGNKDYQFGDINKTKGVPKNAEQLDENSWLYLEFQGFISWLNTGANGSPLGKYKIKSRKASYSKGIVQQDGSVIPFHLTP